MAFKVRIPSPLRPLTAGQGQVDGVGSNIKDLIENLEKKFPGMKTRLYDETGNLRRFVNIYVNEEDIRFLKGEDTTLKEGDEISIVPAIAGGC
ncbi:MAG TPA: MoaD/ThiS family protein [Nitrospiria bacterium]|jgi:molybdopterin synthase sulfur carrier subunit|nr:MoaD/ThiS family protein [Nitrospiria bacterium]